MKKTYNMSETMTRAWAIRKAAAADMGCKVSEVLMGECLKIAWAEAEGANAETNAPPSLANGRTWPTLTKCA